jgi:cell fate (sporulation/competence/biofilm development) regulator YmcA (YheA/YmcA/DUF963 family)
MEKIKDPAMLTAASALTLSVGSSFYFYKQFEAVRADLNTISTTVSNMGHKVSEMAKGDQNRNEALRALSEQIRLINQRIEQLPSLDAIEEIHNDVEEITAALQEHNIEVVLPRHSYQASSGQRSRGAGRGMRASSSRYSSDREDEARRSSLRSTDRTRDEWGRVGSSHDYSSRRHPVPARSDPPLKDQYRDPGRGGRYDARPVPEDDGADDTDLIDMVRRQQPHP